MNIIIISLERASERREKINKQLSKLGIDALIMDAVDGQTLPEEQRNKKITLEGWFRCGEICTPGEIACTMSHIKALHIAKQNEWDDVIILEDDAVLADDFEGRIEFLRHILPRNWEHIYLSGIPKAGDIKSLFLQCAHLVPSVFTMCTHAMMIRSSAYDKIIAKFNRFETTTDDMLCHMITEEQSLDSYTYYPFVAYADNEFTYIWEHSQGEEHPSKQYFANRCRGRSGLTSRCVAIIWIVSSALRRGWRSKKWRQFCKRLLGSQQRVSHDKEVE